MARELRLGISEDSSYLRPAVSPAAHDPAGRYGDALRRLDQFLNTPSIEKSHRNYWQRALESGGTLPAADYEGARTHHKASIRWLMVQEAEEARLWAIGPKDYLSHLRAYHASAEAEADKIRAAIQKIRQFDTQHAYLLRQALQRAMQDFLSPKEIRRVRQPNANLKNGYRLLTVSGPSVREHEFQFLSKLAFFELDELLSAWDREIEKTFTLGRRPWMEFGALRFDHTLTAKSASKMNVVQLGLLARLSSRMRDFTAGHGVRAYSTGQPIPTHGKPCWGIVAEFANCSLELAEPLTSETAQRVWGAFNAKHHPKMQQWPKPAKQEPQLEES